MQSAKEKAIQGACEKMGIPTAGVLRHPAEHPLNLLLTAATTGLQRPASRAYNVGLSEVIFSIESMGGFIPGDNFVCRVVGISQEKGSKRGSSIGT